MDTHWHWHIYQLGPVDNGWNRLRTVRQTAEELAADMVRIDMDQLEFPEGPTYQDFMGAWKSAQHFAAQNGWEADFRQDPVVFWLPTTSEGVDFDFGFVFKQDNNGTTYVVSPMPLPSLER